MALLVFMFGCSYLVFIRPHHQAVRRGDVSPGYFSSDRVMRRAADQLQPDGPPRDSKAKRR